MVDYGLRGRFLNTVLFLLLVSASAGATELRNTYVTDRTSNETARVTNGGLDINIQDQHTRALDLYFIQSVTAPTTLNVVTVVDGYEATLANATGFNAGTYVGLTSDTGQFYFGTQIGPPVGSTITLDTPFDFAFVPGSNVLNLTRDMAVDGSVTTQTFQIGPIGGEIEVDITRIMGVIFSLTTQDDGLFGDLAPLTRGCVLRISNGVRANLWNVKTNGDIGLLGYDMQYPPAPPQGQDSSRFRITYGGQNKHGVTLRLGHSETLEFIIQDDLTGLEGFVLMAQGHVVE